MRTLEEVNADIVTTEKEENVLFHKLVSLNEEWHEILKQKLLDSKILSQILWKPSASGFSKVCLEKLGKNYEPKELFDYFSWEHGGFELDAHTELSACDGELYFRFDEPEDFQMWNDLLHLKISHADVDVQIQKLTEQLQELQKMKEKVS